MQIFRALCPDSSIQRLLLPLPVVRGAAPGFRDAGNNGKNGALMNVGNNGFSWSSAVSGSNGVYLNFNATNLNPSNTNSRAFGLQVRCLQAFIGDVTAGKYGDVQFFLPAPSRQRQSNPQFRSILRPQAADRVNGKFSNLLI